VWPAPRLTVADRGLREGILTRLMRADREAAAARRAWRRPEPQHHLA
jgi:exopolyphosphatase/guanosine-5'-triphosphate,3'-diphosphate pyrophosphatase